MARSTAVLANGKHDTKEQIPPPMRLHPPVGVVSDEPRQPEVPVGVVSDGPRPPVGVVSGGPRPPVGVVSEKADDSYSDWDDEEEEEKEDEKDVKQTVDSTNIPPVGGASREVSAVQNETKEEEEVEEEEKVEEVEEGKEREREGEKISDGLGMDLEDESILSAESESDLPMFGGYTPSSGPRPPQGRLLPISQGPPHTALSSQPKSPSPTATSPTIVTPLSATTGLCIVVSDTV